MATYINDMLYIDRTLLKVLLNGFYVQTIGLIQLSIHVLLNYSYISTILTCSISHGPLGAYCRSHEHE